VSTDAALEAPPGLTTAASSAGRSDALRCRRVGRGGAAPALSVPNVHGLSPVN
jgi:hypothetical protein